MSTKIEIEGLYSDVVNFAMQQNHVPIIRRLVIKNTGEEEIRDIALEVTVQPEFAYRWSVRIDSVPPLQSVALSNVDIKLAPNYLYRLTERVAGTISIIVKCGGDVLTEEIRGIDVLAYDEWSGTLIMPEMVCAFVTPNHPQITNILVKSKEILQKWCGNPSFTAYQSNNPNLVKMQMAAIYSALQSEGISYSMPPASFEITGQRVRLCDRLLETKMGTCLDLTLLYASCLEAVGLHPLIVFLKGHAFAGCWLEEQCFAECIQDDVSLLTKRVAEGINEICLVECTCLVSGKTMVFDEAEKAANSSLSDSEKFDFLVDIKRTRGSGIRPIPMKLNGEEGVPVCQNFDAAKRENMTAAPQQLEVFEKIRHVEHVDITRQQIWERKLLDLSLRNTLINFRVTKNTIQLMVSRLIELEDALADGREFQIMAKPRDWENTLRDSKIYAVENQMSALESLARTEFSNHRIRTFIDENEVAFRITALYRQAKISLEENGTNTLYLALGFLRWYESDISEKERFAPIVLVPVDIVRKSAQKGYVIRVRDEEPQMNITLLEMLRQDFGLTIGGLDPLPSDESGIDLKWVFNTVRQAVMEKSRWDVEELAFIGLFSFSQFIMWNDIRNRSEDLRKNKIVSSLLSGKMEWQAGEGFPSPDTLDDHFSPADLAVPISADSSQLSAICAAGRGDSFVLHGPPGTGKSQTITNIIANALFQGKSVLFIAEKMAALSVVKNRLASIGLAPFCLEIHSNKAKKKDVLDQLEGVLEIGRIKPPEQYSAQAERLHQLRKKLNDVVIAIHKNRNYGFSLYDAVLRYEQYKEQPDCIKFSQEQVETLTSQKYADWEELVSQLKIASGECGGAWRHPLKAFTKCSYSQRIKGEINDHLNRYLAVLESLQTLILALAPELGAKSMDGYDRRRTEAVIALIALIQNTDFMPGQLFESQELALLGEKVNEVCKSGQKRDELENQLLSVFSKDILTYDDAAARRQWHLAETSWFLPKMLGKRKVVKSLKILAKNPGEVTKAQIPAYFSLISEYRANAGVLEENSALFSRLFGLIWNNGRADWQQVERSFTDAVRGNELVNILGKSGDERQDIRRKLVSDVFGALQEFKRQHGKAMESVAVEWNQLGNIEQGLLSRVEIDFSALKESGNWAALTGKEIRQWIGNLEGLRNWCFYLGIKEKLENAGLSNVVQPLENGLVLETNLLPAFRRGISLACAMAAVEEDPCLADFNGAIFENEIDKYRQACSEFEQLTRQELVSRLSSRLPTPAAGTVNSSEIGILQKAIKSGGRMMSIRKLFDSIPNLLRKLCPCMLMSPISVAQYIDPKYPPFDLVVFDEASQLPTCEAVGAIARGENLIVVGDPKQLPPTSFFSTDRVDEDNYDKEDLESVLDDCLAISMPQSHLLWHYRSRHESLIAFSNSQYYDNKLFTFPSPNDLISNVKFVAVDGYYDRGKTKQNRAEAEAVVAEIVRRLRDPNLCKQSIGVVTFNSVQQHLIDDLLLQTFAGNPELEEISNQADEPLFIKNLENVQGDERDVILFSIGYGPDAAGKTALNFGPVNREGGWRRLNVAVSRSRKEMMVFSTLSPEQIDLSKTMSQGVADLKAFLEFAQRGRTLLPVKLSQGLQHREPSEKIIADKIKELGFEVNTNIGCSEYKIDIGIVHPGRKGEYVLGVMLDGKNYRAANTARDRNILQDSVLRSLGWNIHRLWLIDWWENQNKETEKIRKAVENAIEKSKEDLRKAETETAKTPSIQTIVYDRQENNTRNILEDSHLKYVVCSLENISGGAEEFYRQQNNLLMISQIKQVLKTEAPISKNLLCRRILASWGFSRTGARLEKRFEELLDMMGAKGTQWKERVFYWEDEQLPGEYTDFRVPAGDDMRRNIEDIAPEEIANAIKYILQSQVSLLKPDLHREVCKLFGFARGGASNGNDISAGVGEAVRRGFVIVDDAADKVIIKN